MLRVLHKSLLRELALNAAGTLAATLVLVFLASLSLQLGRASFDDLPMTTVLAGVAAFVAQTLNLTLPLAVLATCLLTYGRVAADGEFTAARATGVAPRHVIAPALLLGAVTTTLLGALEDRVIPDAHYASRTIGDAAVLDVDRALRGAERKLRFGDFVAQWDGRGRDADGRLVLENLYFARYERGALREETTAARARPSLSPDGEILRFDLSDVHRVGDRRDGVVAIGACEIEVDLTALGSEVSRPRKPAQLSLEELYGVAGRDPSSAAAVRARAEINYRIALALSGPLFALFGAPLGLRLRLSNRALVFLVGILVVALGYWPLVAAGKRLADTGALPAWLALNVGNVGLLVAGGILARGTARA